MYKVCDINCSNLKYTAKCKSRITSDRHSATPSLQARGTSQPRLGSCAPSSLVPGLICRNPSGDLLESVLDNKMCVPVLGCQGCVAGANNDGSVHSSQFCRLDFWEYAGRRVRPMKSKRKSRDCSFSRVVFPFGLVEMGDGDAMR